MVGDNVSDSGKSAEVRHNLIGEQSSSWPTRAQRIVDAGNDHLNWMHEHFADETLVAGQEPELDLGPGQPSGEAYPAPPEAPARHPEPILPY